MDSERHPARGAVAPLIDFGGGEVGVDVRRLVLRIALERNSLAVTIKRLARDVDSNRARCGCSPSASFSLASFGA